METLAAASLAILLLAVALESVVSPSAATVSARMEGWMGQGKIRTELDVVIVGKQVGVSYLDQDV